MIPNLSPAQNNQLQMIYLLHESGADVTIESAGVTPLELARHPFVDFQIAGVLLGLSIVFGYHILLTQFTEKLQKIQNRGAFIVN